MNVAFRKINLPVLISIALILSFFLFKCQTLHNTSNQRNSYSFFVAGHTYGSPLRKKPGMHPPFVANFDSIKTIPNMSFGILTGDIVYYSRDSFWDKVDQELSHLEIPVHFAVGNHDAGHHDVYANRYGKTFYAFTQEQDLCLVLNPGLGGWNIWNDQLDFLKTQLEKAHKYEHIFVFFHQMLWIEPSSRYPSPVPNSFTSRAKEINFWTEVMPLFHATQLPVYLFAGDVGANLKVSSFHLKNDQNVYMLASGMGNGRKDNYLIVDIDDQGKVQISIRWLQTNKTELLNLEEEKHLIFPF